MSSKAKTLSVQKELNKIVTKNVTSYAAKTTNKTLLFQAGSTLTPIDLGVLST